MADITSAEIIKRLASTQRKLPNSNGMYSVGSTTPMLPPSVSSEITPSYVRPSPTLSGASSMSSGGGQGTSMNSYGASQLANMPTIPATPEQIASFNGTTVSSQSQPQGPVDTFQYDTDAANATNTNTDVNPNPTEFTDEQWNSFNALMNSKLSGAPLGSAGMEGGYSGQPTSLQLRQEMLRDRAQGTGLYSIPKGTYATPEQIMGVRAMADKHYSDLIGQYSDTEKNEASLASKQPAYGLDSVLSGLSAAGASRVNKLADSFDSHPLVKTYNEMQRAALDVQALGKVIEANKGVAKAGEDLQLVYMMAKAMDPESVVREGEYATAQKYLSSMLQGVNYQASRFTKDTPSEFLTPAARKIVMDAVNRKYNANKTQYTNLKNQTIKKINDVKGDGSDIGGRLLTDYEGAEGGSGSSSNAGDAAFDF